MNSKGKELIYLYSSYAKKWILINDVQEEINSINEQLETIVLQTNYVDIDFFNNLSECIAYAQLNSKTHIKFNNKTYTINSIEIPSNLTLIGDNTIIKTNGEGFILNSNINISDITFDGNNSNDRAITVKENSKNVDIKCNFINLKGNDSRWCVGVYVNKNTENINIHNSNFSNFISYPNNVEGDEVGAVRGILFKETINSKISNCKFENIGDSEDGDSIHVQTTPVNNNSFPFDILGYEQAVSDLIITNNTFICNNKRAVKLQASGVIVKNNKINLPSRNTSFAYGFISVLGANKCTIRDNEIIGDCKNGIDINNSKDIFVLNNNIQYKNTKAMAPLLIINSDSVEISKNNFTGYSKYNGSNVIFTFVNGQKVNNLKVNKNTFNSISSDGSVSATTVDAVGISNCTNVNIEENSFYGSYYSLLSLNQPCDNVFVNNIFIDNVERGVLFKKASTKIRLTNITFNNMNYTNARIFTWSDGTQVKTEVFTNKNIVVINGTNELTQGSTKPTNSIEIGHEFFEPSTGKFFKWTGSEWKVISLTV